MSAHVSNALKPVILSVRLGLIRLAWDLNLLLCLHQCHYTSTSYIHSLMRLYEIFKPLPGGVRCLSVCVRPALYPCTSLCMYQQFLISLLALTNAARQETDTGTHLHAPADRYDLICHNDLLFQNLPSQLMRSPVDEAH